MSNGSSPRAVHPVFKLPLASPPTTESTTSANSSPRGEKTPKDLTWWEIIELTRSRSIFKKGEEPGIEELQYFSIAKK